jgi:hypothetical protein
MRPKFKPGTMVEFRVLERGPHPRVEGVKAFPVKVGRCYLVRLHDGRLFFRKLVGEYGCSLLFNVTNRRDFPRQAFCVVDKDILSMSVVSGILTPCSPDGSDVPTPQGLYRGIDCIPTLDIDAEWSAPQFPPSIDQQKSGTPESPSIPQLRGKLDAKAIGTAAA